MQRPGFATVDDVLLAGRRLTIGGSPRAGVVLVHGFSATADHPEVVALARALHGAGLDVVWYDARGHGRSEGVSTLGDLEAHDVAAVVERARARTARVVLVGASMGAIAALRYAAADGDLAGVVAVSCPARWRLPRNARGLASTLLTRTALGRAYTARFLQVRVARRWTSPEPPATLVPRVRAPLAFVHGARDRFIPAADAEELCALALGRCRLDVVPEMGHAFDPAGRDAIVAAVEWALAPT